MKAGLVIPKNHELECLSSEKSMLKEFKNHVRLSAEKAEYYDALLGDRILLVPSMCFKAWYERLNFILSTSAVTVFYEMGYEFGKKIVKELKRKFKSPLKLLSAGTNHWFFMGMGTMEVNPLQFQKITVIENMTVKIRNSFYALAIGKTGRAECHLTRGYLVGGFEVLTGKKWICKETKCLCKGDPY